MRYCSSCGAEMADDAKFCAACGTPVGEARAERRKGEKGEKQEKEEEKGEKGEKDEKSEGDRSGAIMGGMILILLGSVLVLSDQGIIEDADIGSYFLMGIGVVLLLGAIFKYSTGYKASATGFFFGGLVLTALGMGNFLGLEYTGAIVLVVVGVAVIFFGLRAMRQNPKPP